MKLKATVLTLAFILCLAVSAQWTSGGTQLTFSSQHHSTHKLSPASGGGFYVTWNALDTTGKVMLNGFEQNGTLKGGWPAGGIEISNPGGDYWESEIITSEDGGAIVCWWGYTTLNTGADRRHVL